LYSVVSRYSYVIRPALCRQVTTSCRIYCECSNIPTRAYREVLFLSPSPYRTFVDYATGACAPPKLTVQRRQNVPDVPFKRRLLSIRQTEFKYVSNNVSPWPDESGTDREKRRLLGDPHSHNEGCTARLDVRGFRRFRRTRRSTNDLPEKPRNSGEMTSSRSVSKQLFAAWSRGGTVERFRTCVASADGQVTKQVLIKRPNR